MKKKDEREIDTVVRSIPFVDNKILWGKWSQHNQDLIDF